MMLMSASKQSLLFWINAFAWTFRQKGVDETGNDVPIFGDACHVPFITWPIQDEAVTAIQECIAAGEDVNLEKSRDMGASWLILAVFAWYWMFTDSTQLGCVSRKESLVDSRGDMDSLFEKIRYILRMLPQWMQPDMTDRYMHLHNRRTDAVITGESTNSDVGRGGRKVAYMVDEAAAIPNAEAVENSLSQNTPCQIWVSTPHGPNTTFHQRIRDKRGLVLQLPWWRHPEKSHGAEQTRDEMGRIRWTSPWYRRQEEKFSRKTIAQEVDMDHGQAGDLFFDHTELTRHRQDHETPPTSMGALRPLQEMTREEWVTTTQQMNSEAFAFIPNHGRKPWKLWFPLEGARPPQYWSYVFGIDISNGTGASNSVISVYAMEIGQIVAKFWDAYTSPEELAYETAAAGVWFGGRRSCAFLCWENNGPGGIFGRKIISMAYPFYYRQRASGTTHNRRTPRWGWHSNQAQKEVVLGMYRDGLARDAIVNPCKEALDECADYIYDEGGSLIPSVLREEPRGGRALHGDHVIADALCWLASEEFVSQAELPSVAPVGSYAWRRTRRRSRDLAAREDW